MKTICLNMIVRDESLVICRCLESIKDWIDAWVIIDTGSTDGTKEIIQACLKEIPGELYNRSWIDFSHHRNEVLELSKNKGDYLLLIDADERLVSNLSFPPLELDCYVIRLAGQSVEFYRDFLIKNTPDWKWEGSLHENLTHPNSPTNGILDGAYLEYNLVPGYRSRDPQTALKDIEILKNTLSKEPHNRRALFYLAQTYGRAQNLPFALETYQKRVELGEADFTLSEKEEFFWSLYNVGCLEHDLHFPFESTIRNFSKAFQYNPERAEPLYRLAHSFQEKGFFFLAYLLAQYALTLPPPQWTLRIQRWIYEYAFLQLFAECAQLIGKKEEAKTAYKKLLHQKETPEEIKKRIYEDNLSEYDCKK